ncbi:MAG: polysaccharide biosynthesis C-terminal domain-containing protein [Coriobacteriia bacterium]|nr:polysaccharide biosynthesis C-terminal domain-containing protein [Coriobacteriia bacterium]
MGSAAVVTVWVAAAAGIVAWSLRWLLGWPSEDPRNMVMVWLPITVVAYLLANLQGGTAVGANRFESSLANAAVTGLLMAVGYLVAWLYAPPSVGTAMLIWSCAQLCGDAVGWAVLLRGVQFGRPRRHQMHELMRLSLSALPASVLGVATTRVDVLALGLVAPTAEVGRYAIAGLGVLVLGIGPSAIGQSLASRYGNDLDAAPRLLLRGVSAGLAVSLGTGIVAGLGIFPFVRLALGPSYAGTERMFLLLIPGAICFSVFQVALNYFTVVRKKPLWPGRIAGLAFVMDMLMLALLAPTMGGYGAAIASTTSYAAAAALTLLHLRQELRWRFLGVGSPAESVDVLESAELQER